MPDAQQDLFGEAFTPRQDFVPDPRHVRNRLADMLATMRAAERWPWEPDVVEFYRESVWPYLCDKLTDREEADGWRREIEAEVVRLDAAVA